MEPKSPSDPMYGIESTNTIQDFTEESGNIAGNPSSFPENVGPSNEVFDQLEAELGLPSMNEVFDIDNSIFDDFVNFDGMTADSVSANPTQEASVPVAGNTVPLPSFDFGDVSIANSGGSFNQMDRRTHPSIPNNVTAQQAQTPFHTEHHSRPTAAATEGVKHKRVYQACDQCRERKTKCQRGDDVDNPGPPPCNRCRRERKACTFTLTRKKRTSSASTSHLGGRPSLSSSGPSNFRNAPVSSSEHPTQSVSGRPPYASSAGAGLSHLEADVAIDGGNSAFGEDDDFWDRFGNFDGTTNNAASTSLTNADIALLASGSQFSAPAYDFGDVAVANSGGSFATSSIPSNATAQQAQTPLQLEHDISPTGANPTRSGRQFSTPTRKQTTNVHADIGTSSLPSTDTTAAKPRKSRAKAQLPQTIPASQPARNEFADVDAARRWLLQAKPSAIPEAIRRDRTIPHGLFEKNMERSAATKLRVAFEAADPSTTTNEFLMVDGICLETVQEVIAFHLFGPLTTLYRTGKSKSGAASFTSFDEHIDALVEVLGKQDCPKAKSIRKHLLDAPYRKRLIDDPLNEVAVVAFNNKSNQDRKNRDQEIKAKAAQAEALELILATLKSPGMVQGPALPASSPADSDAGMRVASAPNQFSPSAKKRPSSSSGNGPSPAKRARQMESFPMGALSTPTPTRQQFIDPLGFPQGIPPNPSPFTASFNVQFTEDLRRDNQERLHAGTVSLNEFLKNVDRFDQIEAAAGAPGQSVPAFPYGQL